MGRWSMGEMVWETYADGWVGESLPGGLLGGSVEV